MAEENNRIPELLFHTTLAVVDYHADTSGSTRTFYVLGTHTTLETAKAFTLNSLDGLGYEPEDFAEYQTRATISAEDWKHGDGMLVYARAFAGQEFIVGIDTTPNTENLPEKNTSHVLLLPQGTDHLHYVIQTKTDYNVDRSGAEQTAEIEGCYVHRADAEAAARKMLDRAEFSQYDERDKAEEQGQWPFGEDVVVHAVAETGENYSVSVRTVPDAHKKHHKNAHKKHSN